MGWYHLKPIILVLSVPLGFLYSVLTYNINMLHPNPWWSGHPRKIFSLLIKRAEQMIQPAYCSSSTAAWWKNCPLCAKLSFLCSSHDHSTLPKGPGPHGLCSGASPRGVTDSCRCSALSMAPEKRHRCRMNCQSQLHILLQSPSVWNISDF